MTTHTTSLIEEFDAIVSGWDGALLSRSRVVDNFLDLRLSLHGDPRATAMIDDALAGMPGKNLVPREWAEGVLDRLSERVRSLAPTS